MQKKKAAPAKTTKAPIRVDPAQQVEALLKEHYELFRLADDTLALLSIPARVKLVLKGYSQVTASIEKAAKEAAARVSFTWDENGSVVTNTKSLLQVLSDRTENAPRSEIADADLKRWAELLNRNLAHPFASLPAAGATALDMVATQLERQRAS